MSYGFNENEIVETITEMVDKDGFRKKVVTYGQPESESEPEPTPTPTPATSEMGAGFISKVDDNLVGATRVNFIVVNIPENTTVYFDYSGTDSDYNYDVGDTFDTEHSATEDERITDLESAALAHAFTSEQITRYMYIYVYAVSNDDSKVVARTGLTVDVVTSV